MKRAVVSLTALLLMLLQTSQISAVAQVAAVPPLMNFQGRLARPDGTPVTNGNYNLGLSLYSTLTGGTLLWQQSLVNVPVVNGVFSARLNLSSGYQNNTTLSSLFGASAVYLEISINGGAPLTPRQQFITVPYAFKADSVKDGSITGASIANGTITADKFVGGIFNPIAWLLGGNSGMDPASQFLGTTDNQPLVFRTNNSERMRIATDGFVGVGRSTRVSNQEYFGIFAPVSSGFGGMYVRTNGTDGQPFYGYSRNGGFDAYHYVDNTNTWYLTIGGLRALRVQYSPVTVGSDNYTGVNIIGGHQGNAVTAGVAAATLFGGDRFNSTDRFNRVTDIGGTVSGGVSNVAGDNAGSVADAPFAAIGGGQSNTAGSFAATVGGGHNNLASASQTTIGGGDSNQATGQGATVGGGAFNIANNIIATVGGGQQNTAGNASTVAGGWLNTANGAAASIGGGYRNTASGYSAAIPGGQDNAAAGTYSFAAGYRAKANHNGAFVWADSTDADFASTAANQFLIRAQGGVGINTSTPGFPLTFPNSLGDKISLWGQSGSHYGFGIQGSLLQIHTDSIGADIAFGYGSSAAFAENMRIKGNGDVGIGTAIPSYKLHVNGSVAGVGNYNNLSDARYKQNIATFPNALDVILNLRGVTFDWKPTQGMNFSDGRQIGFLAQEVEKVLPELVTTDTNGYKSVAYANVVPVLVEAVKIQQKQMETLRKDNGSIRRDNGILKAENEALKARLDAIEAVLAEIKLKGKRH